MDEMTAFDQQIAREVLREAGPSEPVDGAAVLNDITTASRSPRWGFTMFSALKFIAAGVIVALFGGFLLVGVLTTPQEGEVHPAAVTESPSPMTSDETDLGITYEPTHDREVFEVIWQQPWEGVGPLAVDPDGGVWVAGSAIEDPVLDVAQVGVPGRIRFGEDEAFAYKLEDLEFTEDGTLWGASSRVRLRSLDGDTWTAHPLPPGLPAGTEVPDEYAGDEDYGVLDLTLAPDGALYGLSAGKDLIRIADGEVTGQALGLPETGPPTALAVTPDGTVWVGGRDGGFIFPSGDHGWLFRHANGSSEPVRPLGDDVDPYVIDLAVGPDGSLWALMRTEDDSYLGRYDEEAWSILSTADGLPAVGTWLRHGERMAVGADGRVWFTIIGAIDESDPAAVKGEGLAVFDGQRFTRYLEEHSVIDLAIAPDGSVWTTTYEADAGSAGGIYVVRPEAVAAQFHGPQPSTARVTGVAVLPPEGDSYVVEGDSYVVEMDWSDPRLPSRMLYWVNAEAAPGIEPDDSGGAVPLALAVRLEGPDGAWSGTGDSLASMSVPPDSGVESQDTGTEVQLVLDGEGAYEGLSASLTGSWGGDGPALEGFIFVNPDPIRPTSE